MNCCDACGKCQGGHGCPVGDADSIAASSVPVDCYGRPDDGEVRADWSEFGDKLILLVSVVIFLSLIGMSAFERYIMWCAL